MEKSIYSKKQSKLSRILIEMRKQSGMTQRQLATKLKREHSFIGRIEIGERRLDIIEFWEYCQACDEDPEVIATRIFSEFKDA